MTKDEEIAYLKNEVTALRAKVDALENQSICPYDCDPCHGDGCECDRLGCEGNR